MACCSTILPAAFLTLGIIITFMNGQAVSPGWSRVDRVADIAATIWPVVFAVVAAQGLKTWILLKIGQWDSNHGQAREPGKLSQRLEAICLLVCLVWCLSPFGSRALERAYGLTTETEQNSTAVWYVDRTGYNSMWSANSTSTFSAANRSELVQIIGERYISSLSPSTMLSDQNGPTSTYSLPVTMLSDSNDPTSGDDDDVNNSSLLLSLGNLNGNAASNPGAGSPVESFSFSMVTSNFEFSCGNWHLTLRSFDNTTSATKMSYSESQTLGMSMASTDDSSTAMGTVTFASLNRISTENGTTLARRGSNATSLHKERWEYSTIQCGFEQFFYSEPVQCQRGQNTSVGACVQSAQQGLMLTSVGLSGTELGDFSQEFVSANLPTTRRQATASKLILTPFT